MLRFEVITLFPEMLAPVSQASLLGKAQENGLLKISAHNLRDFTTDKHRQVDDTPYGGGVGMVLKPEPVVQALEAVTDPKVRTRRIYFSPQGHPLSSERARAYAVYDQLVLLCGRYEGVDERIMAFVDEAVSIGDYILSGGELAALIFIDVVARLYPGVVGKPRSLTEDTFAEGLLKHPQYTRPESFRGMQVPPVLLSGDHRAIDDWRRQQSLERTFNQRPDLLEKAPVSGKDRLFLQGLKGRVVK